MVGHTNATVFTEDVLSYLLLFYNSYAQKNRKSYSAKWEFLTELVLARAE